MLNQDAVQSMLKLFTNTIVYFIERQQSLTVDLGAGQLIFKAGRIVEFKPSSSQFSPVTANTVEANSDSSKGSSLTAAMLSQLGPGAAGEHLWCALGLVQPDDSFSSSAVLLAAGSCRPCTAMLLQPG